MNGWAIAFVVLLLLSGLFLFRMAKLLSEAAETMKIMDGIIKTQKEIIEKLREGKE